MFRLLLVPQLCVPSPVPKSLQIIHYDGFMVWRRCQRTAELGLWKNLVRELEANWLLPRLGENTEQQRGGEVYHMYHVSVSSIVMMS